MVDIYHTLSEYTDNIEIFDPWASKEQVKKEYGLDIVNALPSGRFDAVILAVAHRDFLGLDIRSFLNENGVVYDVKGVLPRDVIDARL